MWTKRKSPIYIFFFLSPYLKVEYEIYRQLLKSINKSMHLIVWHGIFIRIWYDPIRFWALSNKIMGGKKIQSRRRRFLDGLVNFSFGIFSSEKWPNTQSWFWMNFFTKFAPWFPIANHKNSLLKSRTILFVTFPLWSTSLWQVCASLCEFCETFICGDPGIYLL